MGLDGFLEEAEEKRESGTGRVVFDTAAMIPGVNVASEGVDAELHGLLAMKALRDGEIGDALQHEGEAALHAGTAALNFLTMGGGHGALHNAHTAMKFAHGTELAHDGYELAQEQLGFGHSIADAATHRPDSVGDALTTRFGGDGSLSNAARQHFDYSAINAIPAR